MKDNSAEFIAEYRIEETLQVSAEGAVYRAVDRHSNNVVLIKKYYPTLLWSDQALNEFLTRVDYLRFIEDEYLLVILDSGQDEGVPYVVYADDSLTLLSQHKAGQTNQEEALNFFCRVAEALDFLHGQDITHGTLSIENIALDATGSPRIFDHGLNTIFKKVLQENMDDGFQNLCVSNPACTSREQLLGLTPTRSSDIYSFGIVSYYYIFGELPYDEQGVSGIASHAQTHLIRTIRLPVSISKTVLRFIEKCIQINPEDRFAGFPQILKVLDRLASGRRSYFPVQRRFAIERPDSHPHFTRLHVGISIVLISVVVSLYLFMPRQLADLADDPASLPSQNPLPSQEATPLQVAETDEAPTKHIPAVATLSLQSGQSATLYKPSIDNETPPLPSQQISLTNLSNLQEISRLGYGKPEEVAISPDNTYIALATSAGIYIFRGNQPYSWIDPGSWASSLQFSNDGAILAVGLISGEIQLWDWRAETRPAILSGHTGRINRILFSKIGRMYSASSDRTIRVWDVKNNINIGPPIEAHSRPINDIALTTDGRFIVSCSDDGWIRVWDVDSGKALSELHFDEDRNKAKAVAISSDDMYFAAGGDSGYVRQWNLVTSASNPKHELRTSPIPVRSKVWSLQYIRNDAELLVGLENGRFERYDPSRLEHPGIARNFEITAPPKDLLDIFGPGFNFSSSAALIGTNIVSINWDGRVMNQQAEMAGPVYDILDRLDVSTGGNILAAGGRRGYTTVWDLTTNRVIYQAAQTLPYGHPVSPDGSAIVIVHPNTVTRSITTGNLTTEYTYQIRRLSGSQETRDFSQVIPDGHVSYARDGTIFIAGNLEESRAWDFASGYEIYSRGFKSNKGCRLTVSMNNPDEELQVYSRAGIFTDWEEPYASKLCQMIFQFGGGESTFSDNLGLFVYTKSKVILTGYNVVDKQVAWQHSLNSEVSALAISPDGKMVAAGDTLGTLVLIDGKTGAFLAELTGNFGALRAIEFSEDAKSIVTAGDDGAVRVFGIPSQP